MQFLITIARPIPAAGYVRITPENGGIEVIRVRVILSPCQTARPDERSLAIASIVNNIRGREVIDGQFDPNLCQVLLERLTKLGLWVNGNALNAGFKAIREASLGEQSFGFLGVI